VDGADPAWAVTDAAARHCPPPVSSTGDKPRPRSRAIASAEDPIPGLFSAGFPGMNIQVAAAMADQVAAIGPFPVPGARQDAHAFAASGFEALIAGMDTAADLGYTGVAGIEIVPFRTLPGGKLHQSQADFNKQLSSCCVHPPLGVTVRRLWPPCSVLGIRLP